MFLPIEILTNDLWNLRSVCATMSWGAYAEGLSAHVFYLALEVGRQINSVWPLGYRGAAECRMLNVLYICRGHFCHSPGDSLTSMPLCWKRHVVLQPMWDTGSGDSADCHPCPLCFVFCWVVINSCTFSAASLCLWKSLPFRWLVTLAQTALLKFTICWFSTLKRLFLIQPTVKCMLTNRMEFMVVTVVLKNNPWQSLFLTEFLVFINQLFPTLSVALHLNVFSMNLEYFFLLENHSNLFNLMHQTTNGPPIWSGNVYT